MTISQPQNLLAKPFANDGNYQIIPEADAGQGRASLSLGFPTETQRPLAQGGVAPNRLDFNGILHMLSAAMFWQQSGGQWTYSDNLNYAVPCLVYHEGELWWCVKENGPDITVVAPGSNETYWINFINFIAGGKASIGNPVGTVIAYMGNTAPDGYLACDGRTFSATQYPELRALLGTTIAPDFRGEFLRGLDSGRGVDSDRKLGSSQGDAIRNITGEFGAEAFMGGVGVTGNAPASGAFSVVSNTRGHLSSVTAAGNTHIKMDISKVVPTANENRPRNVAVLYCIKHD